MTDASISFDRIAERYEATRGGLDRGRRFAAALGPHLRPGSAVLEIGVGTGAIALPLAELGHRLTGIDIAGEMLAFARDRLPGRLVLGDAAVLPIASASLDAVVAVWAIHVVGDRAGLAASIARVLRPSGRFLVISATPEVESNDLTDIAYRFGPELGRLVDRPAQLAPVLAAFRLTHIGDALTDEFTYAETPNDRAANIEQRDWSSLWDLDDETWVRVIQPVLDDLRALPEPDRPRPCVHRHMLSVYELRR